MKRSLYKLAILGCASTCLISAAYANTSTAIDTQLDDEVVFGPLPEISNIACDGDVRTYQYTVTNQTDDPIFFFDIFIEIDEDDSFPDNDDIVTIDDSDKSACEIGGVLEDGDSCTVTVVIDPTELDCPNGFIEDGEIERQLVLQFADGTQRELRAPIDTDVTILGAAQEFAILANDVVIGDEDGPWTAALNTQVSQDVGYATDIFDEQDIVYHGDAMLVPPPENEPAFTDAYQAYTALKNATFTGNDNCDSSTLDISGNVMVNPGFYCLQDPYDNDYFVVDGVIKFNGDKDSLFVFVMPSNADNEEQDTIRLEFERGANFRLENENNRRVNPDNIFWVGADEIEFDTGVSAVGTFLTKGIVFFDVDTEAATTSNPSYPEGPAVITGRVLGLHGDCDSNGPSCGDFFTIVTTNGNTIEKP